MVTVSRAIANAVMVISGLGKLHKSLRQLQRGIPDETVSFARAKVFGTLNRLEKKSRSRQDARILCEAKEQGALARG
jgi:hypothetical protein